MKSITAFFTSSKKKDKDKFLQPPNPNATLMVPGQERAASRLSNKGATATRREPSHRPALARAFFRSVTDVSKIPSPFSSREDVSTVSSSRRSPIPPQQQLHASTSVQLAAPAQHERDPFACIYRPPSSASNRPSSPPSPPRLLPQLPKVDPLPPPHHHHHQQRALLRARAASFGAQPAPQTLGPLPPLPAPPSTTLPPVPQSAPAHAVLFGATKNSPQAGGAAKRHSASQHSQHSGASHGSPRRPSTAGSGPASPRNSHRPAPKDGSPTSVALSAHQHNLRIKTKSSMPQLDQTWAKFLSEVDEEPSFEPVLRASATVPAVVLGSVSGSGSAAGPLLPPAIPPRSRARTSGIPQPPQLPPPNRPLPLTPVPVAPLNVRRRSRAQTLNTATRPPIVLQLQNEPQSAIDKPTSGMFTPPISPDAEQVVAAHQRYDNMLDVVVTPAPAMDLTPTLQTGFDNFGLNPGTGAMSASSSLPYLSGYPSPELTNPESPRRSKHMKTPSGSTVDWDSRSRTVSEMSLSMFPTPPSLGSSSSLTVPTTSLSPAYELPTPPVTPAHLEFPENPIANTNMLYSAEAASRSSSTIRAHRLSQRTETSSSTRTPTPHDVFEYEDLISPSPTPTPPEREQEPESSSSRSKRSTAPSELSSDSFFDDTASGTTLSEDSAIRSSTDTDRSVDPLPSPVVVRKRVATATTLVEPPSPPSHHSQNGGADRFMLLPNFYFDPTFSEPPATPRRNRVSVTARREQLLTSLSHTLDITRSPGTPFSGRVEWGEAL